MTKRAIETRKAEFNFMMVVIGAILLCIGAGLLIIQTLSPAYFDEQGILHENFFLIPMGFLFVFSSLIVFFIVGFKKLIESVRNKK